MTYFGYCNFTSSRFNCESLDDFAHVRSVGGKQTYQSLNSGMIMTASYHLAVILSRKLRERHAIGILSNWIIQISRLREVANNDWKKTNI